METKTMKAMTFRELKTFCETLNDEQLDMDVIASGEERGFDIQDAGTLDEDYYVDDYAMQPISVYDESDNEGLSLEDSGYEIIKKGKPYFIL